MIKDETDAFIYEVTKEIFQKVIKTGVTKAILYTECGHNRCRFCVSYESLKFMVSNYDSTKIIEIFVRPEKVLVRKYFSKKKTNEKDIMLMVPDGDHKLTYMEDDVAKRTADIVHEYFGIKTCQTP